MIFAGKEYGTGSSRDWAAKGTRLLGVRAVIAESFERIHRSNLIGMGVLPLQFAEGDKLEDAGPYRCGNRHDRRYYGTPAAASDGHGEGRVPGRLNAKFEAKVRIDTENELDYFRNGGILHYVLGSLAKAS